MPQVCEKQEIICSCVRLCLHMPTCLHWIVVAYLCYRSNPLSLVLLWMGRHHSDKNELWPTRHPVPCFSNPNPGSSWEPGSLCLYGPPGIIKLPGPGCSVLLLHQPCHCHLPPHQWSHVKWGAGCLMVVSCMPLGVKITKAGNFSPPHSAAPLSHSLLVIFCDRAGGRSGKDEEAE